MDKRKLHVVERWLDELPTLHNKQSNRSITTKSDIQREAAKRQSTKLVRFESMIDNSSEDSSGFTDCTTEEIANHNCCKIFNLNTRKGNLRKRIIHFFMFETILFELDYLLDFQ
eukprot:UN28144